MKEIAFTILAQDKVLMTFWGFLAKERRQGKTISTADSKSIWVAGAVQLGLTDTKTSKHQARDSS